MKHDYDFVILAKGRSGTHMLASFLNSHSMITCEGEYRKFDLKIPKIETRGQVHGSILMYNVPYFALFRPRPKVIHLIRDPLNNALSFVRQQRRLNMRRAGVAEEALPGVDFVLPFDLLARLGRRLETQQLQVRAELNEHYESIEVSYDEITQGVAVRTMPEDISRLLCVFLGVPHAILQCGTRVEFGTKVIKK